MTICEDDAKLTGPVSLFLGVETSTWGIQQFIDAANFAVSHKVTTLFIKVFEVGSQAGGPTGIWYGGINGWDVIYQEVSKIVNVIPYGFLYGDTFGNLSQEINCIVQFLSKYQKVCLDMEGSYWNNANSPVWAAKIAQAVTPIPGKLWLSCPANPKESGDEPFIIALSPAVNVYMPMVYNDYLETTWLVDFMRQIECMQPTIDLSQEFGPNNISAIIQDMKNNGVLAISCWEYQFATANPTLLDNVAQEFIGNQQTMTQLNKQSMVLDILQSNQLIENEMDLCGPWSVGALRVSGPPNQGVKGTAEDVDVFADNMAAKLGYTPANFPGVSVQDMYTIMTAALDPKSNQRNIHWWDITPDVTHIKAALNAGYPVLITANEQNIIEKRTGQRAYPWNLNANHVLPIAGIDKDGDFICPDQLNNNFQGYWPPIYLSSRINPSWATVVQVVGPDTTNPWLKTIPSNDPTKWPAGFNAQNFMAGVQSMNSIFWSLLVVGLDYNSGLAHAWQNDMTAGNWRGAPVKAEFQLPWKGSNVPCLVCQGGFYTWENGIAYWHPFV